MNILMVAPQPFFRARGTPFSTLHRIRALLDAGHHVDLVTYPFGEDIELAGLRVTRARRVPPFRDVGIGPSVAKLFLDAALYFETRKALQDRKYDVLHSHEEAAFFCAGLARRHALPHVYDMHSSLPQQLENFRVRDLGLLRLVFRRLERHVLMTCSGVITICPDLAEVVEREAPEKLHRMIENTAPNTGAFPPDQHDVRAELGIPPEAPIILYTGTFESYQGVDLLLDAFARVREEWPRVRLVLVGGSDRQVTTARQHATNLEILDSVTFTGSVHPSRIPAFLEASDMIVSPRCSGTNTPLKIYDYMRSGRPLIATNLHTHTQVLDTGIAYLVDASVDGLTEGIRQVLSEPQAARERARAAAERAQAHFSERAYMDKVQEFYDRLQGVDPGVAAQAPAL